MTNKRAIRSALLALAATAGLAACGGGDAPAPAPGTLRVSLTDAPGCRIGNDQIDKVYVTVERVRVHQSSDAGEMHGGWTEVAVNPPKRIDLLQLTNGRLEELGVAPIPAGHYTQVRLVLRPDQGNMASNSMMLAGQMQEIPLRTPSAMQSGLKIIRPFTVEPDTLVDLVLDFDACRSIVMMGNGGYALKPTLTADLKTVAGIVGYIDPAVTDAVVSAQKDGKVVRSTVPYPTGQFVLAYLDTAKSPYTFVVTSPTRGTTTVLNVPASIGAVTTLSSQAQPIPLPAAATPVATRSATGTVSPGGAWTTGAVRALQTVGVEVEIAASNVDASNGHYALQLPVAAPMSAGYSTTLPLGFAVLTSPPADLTYRLQASASGYGTQTQNIGTGTADPLWSPTLIPVP